MLPTIGELNVRIKKARKFFEEKIFGTGKLFTFERAQEMEITAKNYCEKMAHNSKKYMQAEETYLCLKTLRQIMEMGNLDEIVEWPYNEESNIWLAEKLYRFEIPFINYEKD